MSDYSLIINGVKAPTGDVFPVINPATGQPVDWCPRASNADLDAAVSAARRAFSSWSITADAARVRLIQAVADKLEDHSDELTAMLTLEQGKPAVGYAGLGAGFEMAGSVAWTRATSAMDLPVDVIQDNDVARIEVHRKPLGVVGSITPWNYPLLIAIWHVIPALRTGNTVVIKPSEFTPLTTLRAVELMNEVLPAGVLNVVAGDGSLGAAMAAHPGIDKLVFTGSTETGRRIMAGASTNLKRLTLELGGNDAAIVLPDVDVDAVAPKLFAAAMINSGQTCAALKRLYLHEDVYESLTQALARLAKSVTVGDGASNPDFGPIQNARQFSRVCDLVRDAQQKGARFLAGGLPDESSGYFFPVSIVVDIDDDVALVEEEPFGPVLPVLRFTDVEDAIARANRCSRGLGGSVWSSDIDRATQLASRLECGTAWINNHAMIQPDAPFGGIKQSGIGVEFGRYGLEEYTSVQTLQIFRQ